MNQLSNYAKLLELEAELQRVSLGEQLAAGRQHTEWSWMLSLLGSAAGWLVKSRGGRRVGVMWALSRLVSYWRNRKQSLT